MGNKLFFTHNRFLICAWRKKDRSLKNLRKSRIFSAKLQLPTGCWIVFWTNYSDKKKCYYFLYNPGKQNITWQCPKKNESPYVENATGNDNIRKHHLAMAKEEAYFCKNCSSTIILQHSFTKLKNFFHPPAFYFVHPWLTTLLRPWTS